MNITCFAPIYNRGTTAFLVHSRYPCLQDFFLCDLEDTKFESHKEIMKVSEHFMPDLN